MMAEKKKKAEETGKIMQKAVNEKEKGKKVETTNNQQRKVMKMQIN